MAWSVAVKVAKKEKSSDIKFPHIANLNEVGLGVVLVLCQDLLLTAKLKFAFKAPAIAPFCDI